MTDFILVLDDVNTGRRATTRHLVEMHLSIALNIRHFPLPGNKTSPVRLFPLVVGNPRTFQATRYRCIRSIRESEGKDHQLAQNAGIVIALAYQNLAPAGQNAASIVVRGLATPLALVPVKCCSHQLH
ncbi:hypothetical protein BC834DRAFT_297415 [Gloeopeniophorella convolvens]|nr:hypothetical protein BC834DRAFT_297415 [Gloeopeniophorella convolvens]